MAGIPDATTGRFRVDPELCLDHACCRDRFPHLFATTSYGSRVKRHPTNLEEREQMHAAMDECPVAAIIDRQAHEGGSP